MANKLGQLIAGCDCVNEEEILRLLGSSESVKLATINFVHLRQYSLLPFLARDSNLERNKNASKFIASYEYYFAHARKKMNLAHNKRMQTIITWLKDLWSQTNADISYHFSICTVLENWLDIQEGAFAGKFIHMDAHNQLVHGVWEEKLRGEQDRLVTYLNTQGVNCASLALMDRWFIDGHADLEAATHEVTKSVLPALFRYLMSEGEKVILVDVQGFFSLRPIARIVRAHHLPVITLSHLPESSNDLSYF